MYIVAGHELSLGEYVQSLKRNYKSEWIFVRKFSKAKHLDCAGKLLTSAAIQAGLGPSEARSDP